MLVQGGVLRAMCKHIHIALMLVHGGGGGGEGGMETGGGKVERDGTPLEPVK
jgi:hypothetical protein